MNRYSVYIKFYLNDYDTTAGKNIVLEGNSKLEVARKAKKEYVNKNISYIEVANMDQNEPISFYYGDNFQEVIQIWWKSDFIETEEEVSLTRLDLVKERFEKTSRFEVDKEQAWYDIMILLEEIHERDILIKDFREQIQGLKSR